ncbi:hypothetical protein DXG01_010552, partial [Tephrocybe rancida]
MTVDELEIRPSFSFLSGLVLPEILVVFILSLNLPKFARIGLFFLCALLSYHGLNSTTGDKMQDYSIEPLREYRHSTDVGDDEPRKRSFGRRFYWAGCVLLSPRGFGWNYQVSNVPAAPSLNRGRFVISRIFRVIALFLIIDAGQTFIHTRAMFLVSDEELQYASITSHGLLFRFLSILAWMSGGYAGIRVHYDLASTLSVLLGLSKPADWPEPFGSWKEAYTVRNFWGRTWHQMLRQFLSSFGTATTKFFGFRKGTNLSSYTQLFVAFTISGILHCFGDAMAVAITAEDVIIAVAKRSGLFGKKTSWTTAIGYAWVVAWFMMSVP